MEPQAAPIAASARGSWRTHVVRARPEPQSTARQRALWFGPELASTDTCEPLGQVARNFRVRQHARFAAAAKAALDLELSSSDADSEPAAVRWANRWLSRAVELNPAASLAESAMAPTLRVALMGRTQAGKSTLLEAMSAGDGERIGDGRQRFSRDVHARSVHDAPHIEIVDTPGVGARDGEADFQLAFAQVDKADLVLWVAANDSQQAQTTRALRTIAYLGKPIVVVLNTFLDLSQGIYRQRFLQGVTTVADDGNLEVILRHLAQAGVRPLATHVIHADAAFRASSGGPDHAELLERSRLGELLADLQEYASQSAPNLRTIRTADAVRAPVVAELTALGETVSHTRAEAQQTDAIATDLVRRLTRLLDRREREAIHRLRKIINTRRNWHLSVDIESDVRKLWTKEADQLRGELSEALTAEAQATLDELRELVSVVIDDWAGMPNGPGTLGELPGFASMYANRALKAGVALGVSGAAIYGGKLGALVGSPGGPVGFAIGLAGGAIAGAAVALLVTPLKRAIDWLFKSREQILKDRRDSLRKQLKPLLNDAEKAAVSAVHEHWTSMRTATSEIEQRLLDDSRKLQELAEELENQGLDVRNDIDDLDVATCRKLLQQAGRARLAEAVLTASRVPGVAMAVEVAESDSFEAVAFPATGTIEQMAITGVGRRAHPVGHALSLLLQLCGDEFVITKFTDATATIELSNPYLPTGIATAWQDLLANATGAEVTIVGATSREREGNEHA